MQRLTYRQSGDWLISECGRWQIGRLLCHHGRNYIAYDWDGGDLPEIIGVADDAEGAKRIVEDYRARN